ncbi:MAG: hypothetical protein JNM37_09310 [Rhodocyclaceae bacterium]|nr:hypothetical protein [Rhodocyclaceae bacterium]
MKNEIDFEKAGFDFMDDCCIIATTDGGGQGLFTRAIEANDTETEDTTVSRREVAKMVSKPTFARNPRSAGAPA